MAPDTLGWLVAQSDLILFTLDDHGRLTGLNPAAEQLFGAGAASLSGRPLTTLLDPFSHAKAALMLERVREQGRVESWELDHLQPAGPPVLVSYTATRLLAPSGEIVGVAAVGRRQSDQLALTAQLAQANQQLEGALLQLEKAHTQLQATQAQLVQSEKMRVLGQMVAGVAHELNNPAAYISNNLAHMARLLPGLRAWFEAMAPLRALADPPRLAASAGAERSTEMDFVWQDLPDLVRESQEGIERIRGIVLALRNFSRLDEAALKLADLNDGLRNTLRLVRPMCAERVQIVESLGELPAVLCRPGELNQVFLNLLMNATQAIDGPGQVWVSSARLDGWLVVTIRDNGSGMPASTLARLGEPFFTPKPVGAGTGLGLAVSRSIVERHKGRLAFESELGRGTTVRVEIPVTHD